MQPASLSWSVIGWSNRKIIYLGLSSGFSVYNLEGLLRLVPADVNSKFIYRCVFFKTFIRIRLNAKLLEPSRMAFGMRVL